MPVHPPGRCNDRATREGLYQANARNAGLSRLPPVAVDLIAAQAGISPAVAALRRAVSDSAVHFGIQQLRIVD